tara:strand:- start:501 stop:620 length:120 start_codon:yes stop_codon:yes gene_type:complete
MARTENERKRDEQMINLLLGILKELQSLNSKTENKNASK